MSKNEQPDKELVLQKCKYIISDIEKLKLLLSENSYEELVTDEVAMTIAERRLERIINRSIDINFHLVRAVGAAAPDDYTKSFLELASIGVLDAKLAHEIAPAAGARNILVHEYDDLDTQLFYDTLENVVRYFPKYVEAVTKYIDKD